MVFITRATHVIQLADDSTTQGFYRARRKPFQELYPEWPGKNVYVDLDIGLIEIDDKNQWTAQIYGIGTVGNLADLSINNISLSLIGRNVRAYGCASREIYGAIHGLFYRYKAVGGFEYMADFLIGTRQEPDHPISEPLPPFSTHPGDSGTLWLLETDDPRGLMPLAVQWGGHVFFDGDRSTRLQFALGTCLSVVCNVLDVDMIRDWNIGPAEYWGAVGHYTIAGKAIDLLKAGPLKDWLQANRDLITYPTDKVIAKTMKGLSKKSYVPLADVPDMVWKVGPYKRGGMKSPEHSNHFADMDQPLPAPPHETLLELCKRNPNKYVSVAEWEKYYEAVGDESQGLLPFRVWQIWDEMASTDKIAAFVCAAGIVSHYVGDSCQPLHISYRFNGNPDKTESVQVKDPKTGEMVDKDVPVGSGVHSAYEDAMVNYHIDDINLGLAANAKKQQPPKISSGHDAAKAVVVLMQQTFEAIEPLKIVNEFIKLQREGLKPREVADKLWDAFGDATIDVIRDGSQMLANIWQSAWDANPNGFGDAMALTQKAMIKLYTNPKFLPSHSIKTIGSVLIGQSSSPANGKAAQNKAKQPAAGPNHKKASKKKKRPARAAKKRKA